MLTVRAVTNGLTLKWLQGGPPGAFPGGYGGAPGGYGGYGAPGYGSYGGYGYMDTQSPLDAEIQVCEFISKDRKKSGNKQWISNRIPCGYGKENVVCFIYIYMNLYVKLHCDAEVGCEQNNRSSYFTIQI